MPLQALNLANKYTTVFGTIGPVKEEWGEVTLHWVDEYWRKEGAAYQTMPRIKFETSNEGYQHFHIALYFQERQRFGMFVKRLQKWMSVTYKKEMGRDKEFSIRLFQVPITEDINGKALRGEALINHYLDNPTKMKPTEGGNYTIELTGFNVHEYLKEHPEKLPWYKKFCKQSASLPPISKMLISNSPSIDQLQHRWNMMETMNPDLYQKIKSGQHSRW